MDLRPIEIFLLLLYSAYIDFRRQKILNLKKLCKLTESKSLFLDPAEEAIAVSALIHDSPFFSSGPALLHYITLHLH